jgi:glycosyltransferase involved in cell wall biosynthesis
MKDFIVITPARNEEENLVGLMKTLESQIILPDNFIWLIVVNGCTDNTLFTAHNLEPKFRKFVLEYNSSGSLLSGGDFEAFSFGAKFADERFLPSHFMKLDADVRLNVDYFLNMIPIYETKSGLFGGVNLAIGDRGQRDLNLVRGCDSCYSREAWKQLEKLPRALGFDVLDKIALRLENFSTEVIQSATFRVIRKTGSSEGAYRGLIRNGRVCRWTGYSMPYFIFRLIRKSFKWPYLLSALFILYGYITAPKSPFPKNLMKEHARYQNFKLLALVKNPVKWLSEYY